MVKPDMQQLLLDEIRLNRAAIDKCNDRISGLEVQLGGKIHKLDKGIMSNKIKLSIYISGVTLLCNIAWVIISAKIKTLI